MSERQQAHSRSEYKRLTAQGVDVEPPSHPPTEDRREPDAVEGAAIELAQWMPGWHPNAIRGLLVSHGLRGPEPADIDEMRWRADAVAPKRARTTEEER